MQEFWVRVVSMMMIVGIVFVYNTTLEKRSKDEEIARLNAMVLSAQSENEETTTSSKDGTYTGEADGFGGKISVEVVIENGEITEIDILSAEGEDGAYLTMAEAVIPDILETQSAEVDSISGATFSSNGIKDAVKQALQKVVK